MHGGCPTDGAVVIHALVAPGGRIARSFDSCSVDDLLQRQLYFVMSAVRVWLFCAHSWHRQRRVRLQGRLSMQSGSRRWSGGLDAIACCARAIPAYLCGERQAQCDWGGLSRRAVRLRHPDRSWLHWRRTAAAVECLWHDHNAAALTGRCCGSHCPACEKV
jgi:hypothetical protein